MQPWWIIALLASLVAIGVEGFAPSRIKSIQFHSNVAESRTLMHALPRAVVFDLDGCLWYPDMYKLWGGGAPFTVTETGDLTDKRGRAVYLLGAVADVLFELKTDPKWADAVVCVASCTDEPAWAQECMRKFSIGGGHCIKDVMMVEEIRFNNKQVHLKNIAAKTGVALEEMLFLDNERGNCNDVASLGVTVAYTPNGVTTAAWEKALAAFPSPGEIIEEP